MTRGFQRRLWPATVLAALMACGGQARQHVELIALVGARLIDGTGRPPVDDAALLVRGGKVVAAGPRAAVAVPRGATVLDLAGRSIMPGLVNAHGHVGDTQGLEPGHYSRANVLAQLGLYARYGVTTVASLGGDGEAGLAVRRAQDSAVAGRARLYVAGAVVAGPTPEAARAQVDSNVRLGVDVIKLRVDDNLGTTAKMPLPAVEAAIAEAHRLGKRVAVHIFYLADAKAVLRAGADFIAHSVRDREVDEEFIALLKQRDVCYSPTLMREVSTFVYASTPAFFSDPFFRREADSAAVAQLSDPARQAKVARDPAAQAYRRALPIAKRNLKRLADAGVRIAMGTDTGPPARFQGYFEHLELEQMADAGLSPMQVVLAATRDAARCLGLTQVGTLEPGAWADFMVLSRDPLDDIRNTRTVESVWVAGRQVSVR